MKPIILIAHGSRDPKWQKPFDRFLAAFVSRFPDRPISLCYMEICSPTLEDVCKRYREEGYDSVTLVPMFMASGGHVDNDIPKQTRAVEQQLSGFSIHIAPPIGEQKAVVDAMLSSIHSL